MNCLNCNKRPAKRDPRRGVLPCTACQRRTNPLGKQVELTTETIRHQRKEFAPDALQPYREGEVSREYIERHGTKFIKATPEEIKNARNVWSGDIDYYKD